MRADHPSNTKHGGVYMNYGNYLSVIRRTDLSDLQECIVAEITNDKERCYLSCLYRSPSQSDYKLETFCSDLTFLLNNINRFQCKAFKIMFDNKDNKTGIALENITSTTGYNQMINKPTHFTNVSASCIDLIFASDTSY